jgi:hypothetical protein
MRLQGQVRVYQGPVLCADRPAFAEHVGPKQGSASLDKVPGLHAEYRSMRTKLSCPATGILAP